MSRTDRNLISAGHSHVTIELGHTIREYLLSVATIEYPQWEIDELILKDCDYDFTTPISKGTIQNGH